MNRGAWQATVHVVAESRHDRGTKRAHRLPPEPPPSPPHPSGRHRAQAELRVLGSSSPLAACFTPGSVYMSVLLSHFISAKLF